MEQVWDALVQLEEHHLLSAPKGGMSRRDLVKKSAVVAVSVPLITSIAMPSGAYAANSCFIGKACTSDNQCFTVKFDHLPVGQRCCTVGTTGIDAKSCKCYKGTTTVAACGGPTSTTAPNCDDDPTGNAGPIQGTHTYTQNTCQWV